MLDAENPAQDQAQNQTAETSPKPTTPTETPPTGTPAAEAPAEKAAAKKTAAKKTASSAAKKTAAKKTTTKKAATKKAAAEQTVEPPTSDAPVAGVDQGAEQASGHAAPAAKAKRSSPKTATAKRTTAKKAAAQRTTGKRAAETAAPTSTSAEASDESAEAQKAAATPPPATALLFQPPDPSRAQPRKKKAEPKPDADAAKASQGDSKADQLPKQDKRPSGQKDDQKRSGDQDARPSQADDSQDRDSDDDTDDEQGGNRRRRRRGGRRRRKSGENGSDDDADNTDDDQDDSGDDSGNRENDTNGAEGGSSSSRRRRRRRRPGDERDASSDDPANTVTRVRKQRSAEDEITAVTGSTRLEAKKQRRREGREAGRRRAPIASEAEFLARREAVDRVMVIRQKKDLTQIAVMEDKVLVEHYVARESQTSLIGNVYLGRVQNVLPSMEAAFIDIGKGRNAVLYAGEVNWDALGAKGGGQRKIEQVLKSGQSVLVQVSKDPIGHKGARLTSQISLPGRFLVYVPDGTTSGISRKLPDTERNRLKTLLKEIVPDTAGVIVRTAAEGASEEELTRDVERLTARWEDIEGKINGGSTPELLYGEPDLTLKVVRDLFTEDFGKLVVSGGEAWDVVDEYVKHIAPDLEERLEKYDGHEDVFAAYRIDEQIAKGLDRKVWLPSGGSLVIDRTEAMTVVDVNTGKFTGSGGNLEETVTKNNLEAAEEIVRQLRLRDIGGIIVVDFIDMVLESNRDLVLRRMVECLGRDRTRHQVAEVTSLGLVQMTRKRIGTGLLEAFSENCEHCQGRGLIVQHEPVEPKQKSDDEPRRNRRSGRGRGRGDEGSTESGQSNGQPTTPTPKDVAAVAKPDQHKTDDQASEIDARQVDLPETDTPETDTPAGSTRNSRRRTRGTAQSTGSSGRRTAVDTAVDDVADEPVADKPVADEVPAAPEPAQPVMTAEPVAPRVVTRRRGAARRPAGPPPGSPAAGQVAAETPASAHGGGDGAVDVKESSSVLTDTEPTTPPHVPVKKKGSRKH